MVWSEIHDELLCREIIGVDVFTGTKKGTTKRSAKWAEVVENLSNVAAVHFKVDNRAVRDRYNLLSCNLRRKLKKEVNESGITVEMSDVEKALEAIIEKEDAAEELRQEGKEKKLSNEQDKIRAEGMKKKAMENLGETQNRKSGETSCSTPAKKARRNGSETMVYLKEKHEKMLEVENKKLELQERNMEEASKRHEEMMLALQRQSQQQMENFQMMMMQQQQQLQMQQAQQNELMLKLFGMINHK